MSGSPGALPPLEAVGASRDTERDLEQLFDSLRQAVARRDAILRGVAVAAGRLLGQGRWEDHLGEVLAVLGSALGLSRVVLLQTDAGSGGEGMGLPRGQWLDPSIPAERSALVEEGCLSTVAVPVTVDGERWGDLCCEDRSHARDFAPFEVEALETAARLFAAAIERSRGEEALRRSEERTRTLLEALPDVLFRVDAGGKVTDVHAGHGTAPLAGALQRGGLREAFPGGRPALEAAVRRVLARQTGERVQVPSGEDGTGLHEVALVPAGQGEVVGVARDVTERTRLELMKSDFVNRAAHELRTPLTTVVVMAELIREGGTPGEIEEYWRILTGELQRQKSLVERLLTSGRLDAGSLPVRSASCDAGAVLSAAVDAAGPLASARGVSLSASIPVGLPRVVSDVSLLPQVFANLLENAVKFTPPGGRVWVEASVSGEFLCVRVSDTGIGIPKEDVPQLFERFFRARNAVAREIPGSGMGLYVAKTIVERSGGRIGISSETELGTTVEVELPVLPLDAPS